MLFFNDNIVRLLFYVNMIVLWQNFPLVEEWISVGAGVVKFQFQPNFGSYPQKRQEVTMHDAPVKIKCAKKQQTSLA